MDNQVVTTNQKMISLDDVKQENYNEVDKNSFDNFMLKFPDAEICYLDANDPAECYKFNGIVISLIFSEYNFTYHILDETSLAFD